MSRRAPDARLRDRRRAGRRGRAGSAGSRRARSRAARQRRPLRPPRGLRPRSRAAAGVGDASARMYFAVWSGAPAPACRSRSTSASRSPGVISSPISTSSSRNDGRAAAVDHRNGVVDDAGDQSPVRVVQLRFGVGSSSSARSRATPRDERSRARARAQRPAGLRRFPRRRSPDERGTARRALPGASRSSPRRAGAGGSRPSARVADRPCRSTSCRCARAAPDARSARPGRRRSACGSRVSRRASARVRGCAPQSSQRSALRFPSHRSAAPARANPAASSTERPRTPP